jgi:hypothetical protein
MTTLTLPRCVVTYTAGHAYPFRSDLPGETATLLSYVPTLPDGYHWATDAEVRGPHTVLDAEAVALLLYASYLDPMAVDDHAVIAAVHLELGDTHTTQHARVVYAIDLAVNAETANARLRACKVRACLLCTVTP